MAAPWIEHDGSGMPVSPETRVHIQLGRETREEAEAANDPKGLAAWCLEGAWYGSDTSPTSSKITAYRLASDASLTPAVSA